MALTQVVYRMQEGMPVAPTLLPLFREAYREYLCLDQGVMEEDTWLVYALELIQRMPRYELEYWDGDTLVGCAFIAITIDFHVGPCVSVLTQFARATFRNRSAVPRHTLRYANRLAQENRVPFISWSQQQRPGVQLLKYRRSSWVDSSDPLLTS